MSRHAQTEPVSSPQKTVGGSSPPTERKPPPPAWESLVFRIGVGLIALHIVDDRFVQPEEGVSPADHLVSGIVPLLILAAALLVYGRLRPGWRAICALVLGVLALAVSSEAVYYTAKVGASGDDFTGLFTIPAGLALLSVLGWFAWRRRYPDTSRDSGLNQRALQQVGAIGPLVEARAALHPRPSWTVLFLKGYALLSQAVPELRRAYVKLPWPQFYEYPVSVASIAFEREHDGEQAVLLCRIKDPEHCSLTELAASIEVARSSPVFEIKDFRRALKMARVPTPVRRLLMWLGLQREDLVKSESAQRRAGDDGAVV